MSECAEMRRFAHGFTHKCSMAAKRHRLLTAEREQRILALLGRSDALSVQELSSSLGVSAATLRRDLASLRDKGMLSRFHGGASLKPALASEQIFSDKESQQGEEKARIARAALELIEDHDRIYLDGGSSVLALAKLLGQKHDLTIVTNSLMAASVLMETGHRMILTGGEFRALSRTLVGPLSGLVLEQVSVEKAFLGTMGLTLADGLSTSDPNEAYTKRLIGARARQVILLADHSKIGVNSFINTGRVSDVDILVTDDLSDTLRHRLTEMGTRVIIA